jgi:hypothetical protein
MIHSILQADRLEASPPVSLPYPGGPARLAAGAVLAVRSWWRRLWAPELRLSREWLTDYEQYSRKHLDWE